MEPVRCSAMCAMPPCSFRGGDSKAEPALACEPLAFTPAACLANGQNSPPLHHATRHQRWSEGTLHGPCRLGTRLRTSSCGILPRATLMLMHMGEDADRHRQTASACKSAVWNKVPSDFLP